MKPSTPRSRDSRAQRGEGFPARRGVSTGESRIAALPGEQRLEPRAPLALRPLAQVGAACSSRS